MIDMTELTEINRYTNVGNAHRYVEQFGKDAKWCEKMKQWFVWQGEGDGGRWVEDEKLAHRTNMHQIAHNLLLSVAAMEPGTFRDETYKWGIQSESSRVIDGSLKEAKALLACDSDIFNKNTWLFNFTNGTLDLRTDVFRPASREDYLTKSVDYAYDDSMSFMQNDCPRWEKFLSEIFPGEHADIIPYLQRAIGYSLTGETNEQCLWLLIGDGANGKGVFIHTLQKVLGSYAMQADWQTFAVQQSGRLEIREDIARLAGARFVASAESDKQTRMAENVVKAITGSDLITARHLHKGSFEFMPQFKLWLASNYEPKLSGTDDGIWRRLRYIPFTVSFKGRKADKHLEEKLLEELPGILNWARRGLKDYLAHGMQEPAEVLRATEGFRNKSDQWKTFMDEHSAVGGQIGKTEFYEKYKVWAERTGEVSIMTMQEFNAATKKRGGLEDKHTKTGSVWVGIHYSAHAGQTSIRTDGPKDGNVYEPEAEDVML
jgi:putative DNA primase/helicase